MATDVIIEPGSGQIYWNDSAGSSQSISIKGDAQNTISVVGYSGAFSPGSSAGGTFVIASFNDNSGTSAFVPGTTNYDLGSTTYRWSVYGYTGNFSSDVVISSSTQSTSVTSGALRVNGGVGISGRMYFNTAAMGTTGIASPPTFAFIGSTGDPIFLQVLEDNSLSFEGSQGQLFSITPNLSTGYIYSVNDITGIPLLRANANANVTANEFGGNFGIGVTNPGFKLHVVGSVGFTSVNASTTPTSGTLVVSGGVGIGQTLNIGGRLNLWNSANTNFTSFVSTATGNTVYILPATTPSTGSSVLQSDSIGNLSWVGFVANSAAIATTAQNINTVFASTNSTHHILFSPVNGGSGVAVSSDSGFTVNPATNVITANTFSGNISATGTTSGFVGVTDNTATTSNTTGALVVTGGAGIGQSVIVGGRVGIGSNLLNAGLTVQTPSTSLSGIAIRGTTSQTADVFAAYSSTGTTSFSVSAGGRARLTGLDGIWNDKVQQNIFDVSDGRINFNLSTWQYSNINWVTAGANISQASGQLQIYNSGTTSVTGVGVVATGWDTGGVNRVFGIVSPSGSERSFFRGYGNLVINPNNPNGLHTGWNTMDLITLDISGTAGTYSGNIFKGSVESVERFSVGPFGNTKITVGTATTATGFIVKAVASQTGNLIETQSSAGATNFYVTPSGAVNVGSTAASISTTTGALTVAGGVGIGGTLYVASATAISGVTINAGVITGTLSGTATTARNTDVSLASTNSTHFVTFTTASSGSGLGQSADADLTYNPSTNVLTTGTFNGNLSATGVTSGLVSVTSSTASTYMANGALTVAGGVGISGQLSFNRAAMGYTGIASNPTMAFIGTTGSPITLTVLSDNGLQFEGTSGKLFGINNNLSTGWIFSVGDISGIPLLRANADGTVAMGEFAGNIGIGMSNPAFKLHVIGSVGFTSVTASTNPTSGTLVVSGGAGIGQSLNVGGRLHLWNAANTNFTAFLSAASGNHTYTLPANVPSTGTSVLQADTSGILSWVGFSANSASIATTSQNLNTVASTTSASHFLLFSPTNGASGVAVSSDAQLTYNPATDVLTASVFSGNVSATAVTSTNFFGTLTGNVTGNVTGTSTTSQNVNTVAATTSATHYLTFSPVNGASGVALSSDANLTFNPSTNVLTTDIFSGNVSATAVTSTNFFGTLTGNVTGNLTGTATTSQNINLAAGANNSNHSVVFSLNATGSGVALSSDAGLQYNPSTNVLTADVFSGNVSATAVTATNFFGTFQGSSATAVTSQNINTTTAATSASHYILFSPVNATTSGVAVSSDASLQFNPATNVLTVDVFSGNASGTAATFTNFFGTHVGNVTGNVTGTATTSQNVNTVAATTSASHFLTFSPVNGASGVALSSDANLTFNPSTNVLTTDVFSGNVSATAVTSTNFFGTLTGNVTGNLSGTATTAQNVNLAAGSNASNHSVIFSLNATGTGIALSSDAGLQYNPSTNVLTADVFSGNVTGTAITATNFFGTFQGSSATAVTAQNVNVNATTINATHFITFTPASSGSGLANSTDTDLTYNPGSNVLTAGVFSGNLSATAATATNFFGTLTGNVTGNVTGTATTSQNINTTSATTAGAHYLLFSPVNATASGVAVSSDSTLQFNPGTNVLTTDVFSGNLSATAATATNFFGTLVGNSSTATTAANMNVVAASTNSAHYITFSPASSGSGLATSADADLAYNPSTNVLTAGVFSGNLSATAATATNFFGTLVGNSSTATTAQNVNLAAGANASNHSIVFSLNATGSGVALSSDAELQYNPSTNALSVGTGNITANSVRIGNAANTIDTSSGNLTLDSTGGQINLNDNVVVQGNLTVQGTTLTVDSTITTIVDPVIVLGSGVGGTHSTADNNQDRGIEFRYSNSGTAVTGFFGFQDTDFKFKYIPNATLSGTNVYSGTVGVIVANLEGNVSATAVTATNFYGTLVGNTATATTSQNINTTTAATASAHYILFSPVNATTSGVAVSSDSTLQFNPGTNVLTTDVFSGNLSATAATATNFYGTHVGGVTGNVTGTATTSQNINTVTATTAGVHYLTFSPINGASGVALSSDAQLTYNPATDVLSTTTFSGNVTGTAITATNFYGTLIGSVGTATTSQNINTTSATTAGAHYLLFSPVNATASGVAVSSDSILQFNPGTNVLTTDVFSGNLTGTAVTATNFYGTHIGNVTGTATTAQNINTVTATTAAVHYLTFSPANGASGVALSSDTQLTYNPGTDVLTASVFSGNHTGTAFTATNFFGALTGNVTGTATTAININTSTATTAGAHYLLFSPVNATASGVAVSSDSTLQFNPGTNVLTTDVFSGNLSATAATATNFFGTLTGNVTGTATTAQNINLAAGGNNSNHSVLFSLNATGTGVGLSSDGGLQYNPSTHVLTTDVFNGNFTGTAATATNFYGTHIGVVTGNVTGNVTGTATTAQNVNLAGGGNNSNHSVVFSLNATGTGVGLSSDAGLQYNPSTNVLTADVFSGNLSGTAVTATNFYGTHIGNVTGTATTAQNINLAAGANNTNHSIVFSLNATGTGVGLSSDGSLLYNPSTNVLSTDVFNGNFTGTAATATNFYGTHIGAVTGNVTGTATTAQNVNLAAGANASNHSVVFSFNATGTGIALSSDASLQYNPSTNVLTADVFTGNLSGTAATATNFYGTHVGAVTGNVTGNLIGTATTSQNVNTVSANTSVVHYITFSPTNGASGVALSSDTQLTYNPATDVLSTTTFSGNVTGTAITATNFYGTLIGSVGTATTSQNVNLAVGSNNSNHSVVFSLNASGTGVGLSSDAGLQYNPSTNVLSSDVFSGNFTGTAATATNFYGTHIGNVSGTSTTSQNLNTVAATTAGVHYLLFSPVNASASGVAVSSDSTLQFNPGTNVLTTDVFSGNLSATAATATNFYGTHVGGVTGNVTGTATTSQNVNTVSATTSVVHYLTFSPVNGASGVALSSDAQLTYNPGTDVLSATTFSGNVTGTAVTATNFFGTLTGNVTGTATTAQNINLAAGSNNSNHSVIFSLNATGTGVGLSSDAGLQYNPSTNVLTADVFSGNFTGTAATATNFFGTHVGAVTGNVTGTATTSQNLNTVAATTAGNHFLLFSPVNGASGVAVSSDATLQFNPATNVLTTDVFSGNVSGTAVTATNFFGTLTGNVTGTATTAQNINLAAGANNSNHSVVFSLNATGTGVGLSSDAGLQYNPSTNVLTADVFSGNVTGTAITATNFFGTHVGAVTGNVTGTATTAQNVNVVLATTAATHFVTFSPASSGSGLATSADTQLTYNPATDVLSATTFSGNVTGTAITATNFYGTLVGSVGTATTSANVNTVAATTAGAHYILFSPVNGASGVAVSSEATLQFNPGTNVLTTDVFSGNLSATATTSGFVRVSDLTPSTSPTTGALIVAGGVGIGGSIFTAPTSKSSISGVSFNNSRAENGFTINATSSYTFNIQDAANNQRLNYHSDSNRTEFTGNNATHEIRLIHSNNSGYTGFKANSSGTVTYTLPAGDGSNGQYLQTNGTGTLSWTTVTGGSGGGSSGVNAGGQYQIAYYASTGSSVDGSSTFTNNTATSTVSITHATSSTATNVGALVVTGGLGLGGNAFIGGTVTVTNSTASTTTANGALVVTGGLGVGGQINSASLVTSGNATISGNFTFNGVGVFGNATSDTVNFTARLISNFVPNADITYDLGLNSLGWRNGFIQYLTGTAVTATNFFGTLTGNVTGSLTGSATTAQSVNTVTATTAAVHYLAFSPTNGGSGVALSSDTQLTYNPATDVLSATTFSGNVTGTAITATNFYGTLVGNVGSATTATNINTTAATTAGVHYLLFSPVNASASGVAVSSDAQLQFNPGTNVLTVDVFSGNLSGTAATATNFYGTHIGNVTGTSTTSQNLNTVVATTAGAHYLLFSPVNGASGVAVSSEATLQFNPATNVLTTDVFSGNLSGTAATSGLFAVGNLTYAAPNLLAAFQSSVNSYNQVIIQNSNNGASASADLVLNNDTSTDIGRYGNFGMNSSGYTGLGSTGIPNAVYLTSTSSELVLGTTTNNRIRFVNENIDTFQITGTGSSVYTTTATLSKNSGAFVVAGGAAIGLSLSVGQGIQLYNSTNGNHTGFKAGATSANSVYTLPLAYPSTGSSILQSDTSGTMIWVNAPTGGSATPAGNNTELQYNNAGAFGGATGLTWQNSVNTLQINSNSSHTTSTQVGLRLENGLASGGQATRWSPSFEMVGRSGIANVFFSRFTAEVVPSGPATYASALRFKYSQDQGTASFSSNLFSIHSTLGIGIGGSTVTSNFMSYIRAHESQAADIFYKLPLTAPGTGASFLQCDTSGNMSWVNSPGGGSGSPAGSSKQIQFNNNGSFGGAGGFEYISVGGTAVTVSMFSLAGGGYTSGLWVNVLSASSTRIGIGISNPQYELEINGELSATNKSFVINHPTKPGMKLRYGSLEGPENGVYVRGELNGSNIIEVPDHWIGLVHEDSYTVHLTPIGRYSQLYVEKIENYNVYIADNFMNSIHCYYSVWAERKDIPKLVTEY
jgi:hypothetical protein